MRVEQTYYGDFKITDELPFDLFDLTSAANKIYFDFGRRVTDWPVTIEYNERTMYWEVYFTRPVTDEEYVATVSYLPGAEAA
jgi:hypothetical protein